MRDTAELARVSHMRVFPLAIGHRGAAGHMPENTMVSFEKALELGADAIEFDVALCLDGVPVIIHDDTLERTTDSVGLVADRGSDEVRALDAGSWRGHPARVPTLEEVLVGLGDRTLLNLEIKESPRRADLVDACARMVDDGGLVASTVFSSFDLDALRLLRRLLPEARIGVLCVPRNLEEALSCAAEIGAENLHPPSVLVTAALIERAHAQGLRVWTWTANDPADIERLCALEVEGIFSDYPERVVTARNARH